MKRHGYTPGITLIEQLRWQANEVPDYPSETAELLRLAADELETATGGDESCVCKGNWRNILKRVESLIGREFLEERTGLTWHFFGLVHGDDDYYYGMFREGKLCLSSCVGSLEGNGYTLIGEFPSEGKEPRQ